MFRFENNAEVMNMTNLNQWFEKGMTYQQYVDRMTVNKEEMLSIYNRFNLHPEHVEALKNLKDKDLRVIALTEDWCGDAMLNNPILMKITETAGIEVRYLLRDQNLELMDQYLTNGISRSIPIYIFLDKEGNEYTIWGPRAAEVQLFVAEERAQLPETEAPDFAEKQKQMYKKMKQRFLENEQVWSQVADSIIGKINK
jgi:hypothetical protein